ncbi:MAG: LysM peptidoglycan-binding domain-containing M23 family metallopeptidase [Synergistaceae bacterium]|nr:LysM peptidoglycan-binding domain-containing M23 family metallopeptidase [Synergistaceae bacterium]
MKTSKRKKVSSLREIRWGFGLLVFLMLGLSVFLTISAESRFSGVAWGNLMDRNDESISQDGFIVVDLSDIVDIEMERRAEAASMQGAAFAGSLTDGKDSDKTRNFRALSLPGEVDAFSTLPKVESTDLGLPSSAMVSLTLPMLLDEPTGDFGPLPRDLADFESIILNTTEDGMRLPDDSLEDLPGMELPDDDIILAEVGVHWKEHVVKPGETLSDIVLQYGGVTAQDLLRANSLKDANRLAAQQILLVPNGPEFIEDTLEEVQTRKGRVAALREQVQPLKVLSYVVAAGDNLWSIANSQNLEVDTLVGSNTFKNSAVLHPGVVLRIPNQDGIFYKFKNGDKIQNVAKRYQVSVDKIRKVNPTVDLVSLKTGSEIFLPGARPEAIAEPRAASNAKKSPEAASAKNSSGVVQKSSRSFRWPVMGKINSPFGWRRHPITRRRDFHTGLDIKASRGTVIRSSREGQVVYSGWMGGYGKVVVVEHSGGQSTLYAHCSSLLVKQGAKISVGQNIARVGSTGRTTGPHLHFEVRNGNSPVNPLQYLK